MYYLLITRPPEGGATRGGAAKPPPHNTYDITTCDTMYYLLNAIFNNILLFDTQWTIYNTMNYLIHNVKV